MFHWCWRISQGHGTVQQADADPMAGVDILWNHGSDVASKAGAAEMVAGFGLAVPPQSTNPPSKATNHTKGIAIDMTISWAGTINIKKADNTVVPVPFQTNVNANTHWSHNGR